MINIQVDIKMMLIIIIIILFQSFVSMEKGFFQFIDDNLAKKCSLMQQIPQVGSMILLI